jgi:F-box protein 18 (helicase)
MELTEEQKNVLSTDKNVVINAVAGSGKTTTLIEYAKTRSSNSKILYLAFNKTVKEEAIQKFAMAGLRNVRVETAHSLAFDYIVRQSHYQLNPGYKAHEWCDLLNIKTGDRQVDFAIASHVNKFLGLYCNSRATTLKDLDYPGIIADPKAAAFVKNLFPIIECSTREALVKMENGEICISHDFYLKKFQLSKPLLAFDYILFDEGQDASAAMLDVFLRQQAKQVIVGDVHQQIYGWRYAINSLQQVDFPIYNLSNSFRFDEEVALVANKILGWKKHLGYPAAVKLNGVGKSAEITKSRAVLGRTNLKLLLTAISKWQQGQISKIYFEGNINSYTFADEGASLYDVLSLYNGRRSGIRDKLIAEMRSMKELEEYIQKTEDNSLAMIVDVVKEFGNRLPSLINELKTHHVSEKQDADMIFSTVHRCKGMEYDEVTLVSDFITEEKLKRKVQANTSEKLSDLEKNKLAEEINTLYVAATRAKNKLIIPSEINPLQSIQIGESNVASASIFPKDSISHSKYSSSYRSHWDEDEFDRKYRSDFYRKRR